MVSSSMRKGDYSLSYPEYLPKIFIDLVKKDPTLYFINENIKNKTTCRINSFTGKILTGYFKKIFLLPDGTLGFVLPQEEILLNKKTGKSTQLFL